KIELAKLLKPNEKIALQGDLPVAKWVPYDVDEFGPPNPQDTRYVTRMAGETAEMLVLLDPQNVTGDYLTSATKGIDESGAGAAVHFSFNAEGARRFEQLTGQNLANPATPDHFRHLAILLDNKLTNAPVICHMLPSQAQISGNMNDRDVELTIDVLNVGSLPVKVNKQPITQEIISPTLG